MAFEIVDGMTGTKHISSDDLSALNTATVGKADCVLGYGDNFELTMQSANSATLGTGVGMVGGKRFWNQAATSLTIQSGTQGQKRNDLIVARYEKNRSGVESITPVVIKGTPTTGTAADPKVTANDLKLWRVPLNGINAETPAKLFSPVTPLATLGDSVSHASGKVGSVSYFKTAGIVIVSCLFVRVAISSSWGSATIGRLPEGFRPASRVIAPIASDWASGNMSIDANGTVAINANNDTISTASSISSIAVFPAA